MWLDSRVWKDSIMRINCLIIYVIFGVLINLRLYLLPKGSLRSIRNLVMTTRTRT